jgi:hypothetical protein
MRIRAWTTRSGAGAGGAASATSFGDVVFDGLAMKVDGTTVVKGGGSASTKATTKVVVVNAPIDNRPPPPFAVSQTPSGDAKVAAMMIANADAANGAIPPPPPPSTAKPTMPPASDIVPIDASGKASLASASVGTQDGGYLNKVPLPRAPLRQSTAALMTGNPDTCYSQVPQIPTWSDLMRSHLGAIRSKILPLAPRWLM